jgi:hypothetical protein
MAGDETNLSIRGKKDARDINVLLEPLIKGRPHFRICCFLDKNEH